MNAPVGWNPWATNKTRGVVMLRKRDEASEIYYKQYERLDDMKGVDNRMRIKYNMMFLAIFSGTITLISHSIIKDNAYTIKTGILFIIIGTFGVILSYCWCGILNKFQVASSKRMKIMICIEEKYKIKPDIYTLQYDKKVYINNEGECIHEKVKIKKPYITDYEKRIAFVFGIVCNLVILYGGYNIYCST
jgi:hypothetical protein